MFDKKIVICGAGDIARNFLDYKPSDCQVKYIIDSDVDKVGSSIHGVKIFDRNHLATEKSDVIVLLMFNDEETEIWLESLGVEWYRSYGRSDKNFFCRKEIVRYIDDEILSRYRWDKRIKKSLFSDGRRDNFFRKSYCSETNKNLVQLMASGKYEEADDYLTKMYSGFDYLFDDEFLDYRPAMRLIKQIIEMNYKERICICDLGCGNGELLLKFDGNTDKSAVKRDKWYKAIRSSGKIVSKMESSHLCYGLETDFIKMCNSYFSLNYVLPLKKINFENKVFLGPGNPDKMLEMEYGDYMQWPNDAGSTAHGANRRFSRYKNYSNPRYIHTKSEAEDFCKEINEKAGDYQLIVEKYKIFNWKEYFDIVDYLDEHDISYIVYA